MSLAELGFRFDTLRNMRRRDLLLAALAPSASPNLRDAAAAHVAIAEKDRSRRKVWGRNGGTAPEHESAAALAKQLIPFLPKVEFEPFHFKARSKPPCPRRRRSSRSIPTATGARFRANGPS